MAWDFDFQEEKDIQYHIKTFLLYPDFWIDKGKKLPQKLVWKRRKFVAKNIDSVPNTKGVYAFVVVPKYDNFFETRYLFYVGKTNRTLRQRYREYLREKAGKGKPRKKVFKMLNQYDGCLHFYYAEIASSAIVDVSEESLLNVFVPHINTSIPEATIKNELKNIYERN